MFGRRLMIFALLAGLSGCLAGRRGGEDVCAPAGVPLERGAAFFAEASPGEAVRSFDEAIGLAPECPAAHLGKGVVLYRQNRFQEAVLSLDEAVRLAPGASMGYYNRGLAYSRMKEYEKAVNDLNRAVTLNPSFAEAVNNLGLIYYTLNEPDLAIRHFERAAELQGGGSAEPFFNMGAVHLGRRDHAAAARAYDQALAIRPDDPAALNNRGLARLMLGQAGPAAEDFSRSLALAGDDPDTAYNLGLALEAEGRLDEALAAYSRAVALAPDSHPGALERRGVILWRRNRRDEALSDLKAACAKGLCEEYERARDAPRP